MVIAVEVCARLLELRLAVVIDLCGQERERGSQREL